LRAPVFLLFPPLLLSLAALVPLVGCDDEGRPSRPRPEPSASATPAEADAGERVLVDPPAPAGSLKSDIDGFTTVDACVASHSGVDPVVGDALEAIGYDTLLRDACHALDAARTHDTKRCDDILASSLRARCVATVAELEGDPDRCPWDVPSRPERGRDPVCLAVASRDPRPCAAALQPVDRASCEAIVGHDAASCARLGAGDRARCERDARRWSGVVPAAVAHPTEAPHARATAAGADDAGVEEPSIDVARGVVLVERIDGAHVVLGRAIDPGSSFLAASPGSLASLSFELLIPADSRKARVEGGELRGPGRPDFAIDGTQASGLSVKVTRFERSRGGALEVSVSGVVRDGVRIEATASTFVRDVVKSSAMLNRQGAQTPVPRLGDGGGMR
jgi:hypothetical protein